MIFESIFIDWSPKNEKYLYINDELKMFLK